MTRLEKFTETLETLHRETPRQLEAFYSLMKATKSGSFLETKHKALTLLALGVSQQCDSCIAVYVKQALEAGAGREEILEAAWLAVLMGGGPKLTYMEKVLEELELNGAVSE